MTTQTRPVLKMVGEDGNAFAILGRARKALRKAGFGPDFIMHFIDEATSSDYEHLINTVERYFDVDGESL